MPPLEAGRERVLDYDELKRLFRSLGEHGVEYVLVGGVAMSLHGVVRATEDVDVFVRPTEENAARLRVALRSLWDDDEIDGITAEDLGGRYPTIRYGPPDTDWAIDLLSRLGTRLRYDDLESEESEIGGVPVRVATPRALYRMKRDTVRPIDRADAEALRLAFDLEGEA